jgi:hypothetical protein
MQRKTVIIIWAIMLTFLFVAYLFIDSYYDKIEAKADDEFIQSEYYVVVDSFESVSRGFKLYIKNKEVLSLGSYGIYLRGNIENGDSLIKPKGVKDFYILTKESGYKDMKIIKVNLRDF